MSKKLPKPIYKKNGIKIKTLIKFLKKLPNQNGEVWAGADGRSSQVVEIWPLNDGDDVLLVISNGENNANKKPSH